MVASIADHYTDLLDLNWRRRTRLLQSLANDFAELVAWDVRIEAALEGLRHLGTAAHDHLQRCLHEPIRPGLSFAAIAHGLRVQHEDLVQAAVAIVRSLPGRGELLPALVAAMEWSPANPLWLRTLQALPPLPRLQVLATRRRDAVPLLESTFDVMRAEVDSPPEVLAAALRCLRYKGDARALETGAYCLESGDAGLRLAAGRGLLALCPAHEEQAIAALMALVRDDDAQREAAARCLALHAPARVLPLLASRCEAQDQPAQPTQPGSPTGEGSAVSAQATRLYLQALGWAGGIEALPQLIEYLDSPQQSRVAAASIMLLTGSEPVRDGWQGPALYTPQRPADDVLSSTIVPPDPDAALPWPSREAFVLQWRHSRQRFTGTRTLIGGQPATAEHLRTVLRQGPLAWRPLAAERLQRLTSGPLFPTCLPASAQAALF